MSSGDREAKMSVWKDIPVPGEGQLPSREGTYPHRSSVNAPEFQ